MKIVEDIFNDYMQENDVQDSPKIRRANKRLFKYLGAISNVNKTDIEDMLTMVGYEYEKQGFVNGFVYALQYK